MIRMATAAVLQVAASAAPPVALAADAERIIVVDVRLAGREAPPQDVPVSLLIVDGRPRRDARQVVEDAAGDAGEKRRAVLTMRRSATFYFGPEAPAGWEANWIQTVPGKGWFSLLRLYSPTEAWFEGKWLPGEFELVQ